MCNAVYSRYAPIARLLPANALGRRKTEALVSSVLDNAFHLPLMYIPAYIYWVESSGLDDFREKLKTDWWPLLSSCWTFWVPFMACNFAVVPSQHRVKAVAVANFGWTMCLDYISHNPAE